MRLKAFKVQNWIVAEESFSDLGNGKVSYCVAWGKSVHLLEP